ncbi:hypothetical protein SLS58_002937 [Diplodia intermedia]|uniref:Uncharacterized protein n=1 Tax=Diplodia intermedia TaxID=856260 RepID=A0ABR3TYQ5_9PEZI
MRAPSDRNLPTSEDELAVNTEDDSAVKAEDEPVVKVEDELAVKTENEPNRNAAAVNANSNTAAALAPASPPIATVAAEPCPGRTSAEVKGLLKAILDRYDNFLREEAQMMAELAKLLDTVEE